MSLHNTERPSDSNDPGRNWRQTASPSPEPQPPVAKKSWLMKYQLTLLFMTVILGFFGLLRLFVYLNPPPEIHELQNQVVKVLSWQRLHPQLRVLWPDGNSSWVEFPNTQIYKERDEYSVISLNDQRRLVGRYCQIWSRPVKFGIKDRHQVFAIDCGDGIGLDFDKAANDYKMETRPLYLFFSFLILVMVGPIFVAEIIRDRKLKREL